MYKLLANCCFDRLKCDFQNYVISHKISFSELEGCKLKYRNFVSKINEIQNSLYKNKSLVSVVHVYSCADKDVNQNVLGVPDESGYLRWTLFDRKNLCVILFSPKNNKFSQTPPHSHFSGVRSISITGKSCVEVSFNCVLELSGKTLVVTLQSCDFLQEAKDSLSQTVDDHIVCFVHKEFICRYFDISNSKLNITQNNKEFIISFLSKSYSKELGFLLK
jgi:hypothetical protein